MRTKTAIMMKKFGVFYPIVFLMIIALFVISAGGCGGSSHSSISDTGSNETDGGDTVTQDAEETIATKPQTVLSVVSGMDSNGNGKPDFLDFTGVPQIRLDDTVTAGDIFDPV